MYVPLIQKDKKFKKVRNRYVPSPTRPIFIVKVHRKRITKGTYRCSNST